MDHKAQGEHMHLPPVEKSWTVGTVLAATLSAASLLSMIGSVIWFEAQLNDSTKNIPVLLQKESDDAKQIAVLQDQQHYTDERYAEIMAKLDQRQMNPVSIEKPFLPDARVARVPILLLPGTFKVENALRDIKLHPHFWNKYRARAMAYNSPHTKMSDMWLRYNNYQNFNGDLVEFNREHVSVWYDEAHKMPSVMNLVFQVYNYVQGRQLGGVLLTKIPPGGKVEPHVDSGWHASYYEKFAVQLMGNEWQSFRFEGYSLSAQPGELYTFDNSRTHWVTNDSDEDRMTLIICVKR
jgi:hypothetical protein